MKSTCTYIKKWFKQWIQRNKKYNTNDPKPLYQTWRRYQWFKNTKAQSNIRTKEQSEASLTRRAIASARQYCVAGTGNLGERTRCWTRLRSVFNRASARQNVCCKYMKFMRELALLNTPPVELLKPGHFPAWLSCDETCFGGQLRFAVQYNFFCSIHCAISSLIRGQG